MPCMLHGTLVLEHGGAWVTLDGKTAYAPCTVPFTALRWRCATNRCQAPTHNQPTHPHRTRERAVASYALRTSACSFVCASCGPGRAVDEKRARIRLCVDSMKSSSVLILILLFREAMQVGAPARMVHRLTHVRAKRSVFIAFGRASVRQATSVANLFSLFWLLLRGKGYKMD